MHLCKELDSRMGCCVGYMMVVVVVGHKPDAMVDLVKMAVLVWKNDLACPVEYIGSRKSSLKSFPCLSEMTAWDWIDFVA